LFGTSPLVVTGGDIIGDIREYNWFLTKNRIKKKDLKSL